MHDLVWAWLGAWLNQQSRLKYMHKNNKQDGVRPGFSSTYYTLYVVSFALGIRVTYLSEANSSQWCAKRRGENWGSLG